MTRGGPPEGPDRPDEHPSGKSHSTGPVYVSAVVPQLADWGSALRAHNGLEVDMAVVETVEIDGSGTRCSRLRPRQNSANVGDPKRPISARPRVAPAR